MSPEVLSSLNVDTALGAGSGTERSHGPCAILYLTPSRILCEIFCRAGPRHLKDASS